MVDFPDADNLSNAEVLTVECDVLIPAALENAIRADNAGEIKARIIGEGANGPTTAEADTILHDKGVTVIPDILANAGGVTVSYFEWVQNRQEMYWSGEEVDTKLTKTMVQAYRSVADMAKQHNVSLREASYRIAIERVAHATLERGM